MFRISVSDYNRMRKAFLVLLAFSFSSPFYGQNLAVIDSLMQRVASGISVEAIVDAHVEIALQYSGSDATNSELHIRKATMLADSIGYSRGKADAIYVMSRNAMLRGDYDQSALDLEVLMDLVNRIDYTKGEGKALFGLGWLSYYRGEYQKSIGFHKRALAIRNTLPDQLDVASSMRGLGITYKLIGDFDQALFFLHESLEIERSNHHQTGIAECLNHIGVISGLRGDYPAALEAYFQALGIQEDIDDKSGLAYTYQNIGLVHNRQGDYAKTLEYYELSLKIRQAIGEMRGVAQVTYYMGVVYHELRDFAKAEAFYSNALEMKEGLGDKRGVADGYLNMGRLFEDQGSYAEAIDYQSRSLAISSEIDSDWGKVNALIALGGSHLQLGAYLEAKQYLMRGIDLARSSRLLESIRDAAKLLATAEMKLGHFEDAYEAQVLFQQVSDSLSNEAVTKRITLLEAEYQFEQVKDSIQFANEREKLLLDQEISHQRNMQLAFLIAVIVLVVVLGILYRYYHLKNDSNRRLSLLNKEVNDRNESLRALNEEKNNLINIVAHDLKSPIAGIIGAAQLMDDMGLDGEKKEMNQFVVKAARRMSNMVSEILNVEAIEKNIAEIRVRPYNVSSTVEDICNQFSGQAARKEIAIERQIDTDLVGLVDERYINQVVENLLSNALKFSPPKKNVVVRLSKPRDYLTLEVKDEGPGLSIGDKQKLFQRFQRLSAKPTGNESSTGLGLFIVKEFVEKMGGHVGVESELGEGASFFVELQSA